MLGGAVFYENKHIQLKPLYEIILGQRQTDSNNQLIIIGRLAPK